MPKDRRVTDCDGLLREARRRGAEITKTSDGHYKIEGPAGMAVVAPKWGDPRARNNVIADVRRHAGIDVMTPVDKFRPAPTQNGTPPKMHLNGKRPELAYEKPSEAPVTRADHDALLSMLDEQAEQIRSLTKLAERNTKNLDYLNKALNTKIVQLERRIDELPAGKAAPVEADWITELRVGVTETLTRFGTSYVPRMTIAEGLGMVDADGDRAKAVDADALALKRLSYVLMMMRTEGVVESLGVKSATRWRLAKVQA